MTLSLSKATKAWFLKKSTLSTHDFETFQSKNGHCVMVKNFAPENNLALAMVTYLDNGHTACPVNYGY